MAKNSKENAPEVVRKPKGKKAKNAIYDLWITNLFIQIWEVLND